MSSVTVESWAWASCLTSIFTQCFQQDQVSRMLQYDNTSVCSYETLTTCTSKFNCFDGVADMVYMLMDMMFGKCGGRTTTTPVSPTSYPTYFTQTATSIPFGSHIYGYMTTCARQLIPGVLIGTVFPPSESTRFLFVNENSKELFNDSLHSFCSKQQEFSQCVSGHLSRDRKAPLLINITQFETAVQNYCAHKDLVVSQFQCTLNSMTNVQCHGGIIDLIHAMDRDYISPFGYSCSGIKQNYTCRVEKQLKPCNAEYANVMNDVTNTFLTDDCQKGEVVIEDNPQTDVLSCYGIYVQDAQKRRRNYNFEDPMSVYITEMTHMCKLVDPMLDCMAEKSANSSKPLDQVFKLLPFNNLKKVYGHLCSYVPDIFENAACLGNSLKELYSSQNGCIANLTEQIGSFQSIFQNADPKNVPKLMSGRIKVYWNCYKPSISKCDVDLSTKLDTSVMDLVHSMADSSYVVPDRQTDGKNAMSPLFPAFSVVLSAIVAAVVI